jgi:hypothetical protein
MAILKIFEVQEGDPNFQDSKGYLNPHYFGYYQILGKPEAGGEVVEPFDASAAAAKSDKSGLSAAMNALYGVKTSNARNGQKTYERVTALGPKLWTPRAMQGAEYERGGFASYVTHAVLKGDLVASEIDVEVKTGIKPSSYVQGYMDIVKSLRKDWQDACGAKLADRIPTKVYIIAPESKMQAARDMIMGMAYENVERDTHRGLGFNRAVAYQTLTDEQKDKLGHEQENVGWFEIHQGIFFTIDKDMAEKAKVAFGAKNFDPRHNEPKPGFLDRILGR